MTKTAKEKKYQEAYDDYIEARDALWVARDELSKGSKVQEAKALIRKLIGELNATDK